MTTAAVANSTPSVYFVRAVTMRLIKIGAAVDVNTRLRILQVGSPDELELVGGIYDRRAFEIERELHARFRDDRVRGEWFTPSAQLLAFVAENSKAVYERSLERDVRAALESL